MPDIAFKNIMGIMNNKIKISICGDTCSECPRYIATIENDTNRLVELAQLWYRLGFRDRVVEPDEIRCVGCDKTKACSYGINTCPHLEGKDNCGQCDVFPCEKIINIFEKTDDLNERCKRLCPPHEYLQLQKAFLMKRETLYHINEQLHK